MIKMIIIGLIRRFPFASRLLRKIIIFVISAASLLINVSAAEPPLHTSQEIRETAKIFLEKMASAADNSAIEVEISQLDPRLKFRRCAEPLKSFIPAGSKNRGKLTVAVSCSSPVAWKVYISADIAEYAEVIVASRTLARKSLITPSDITWRRVNISSLRKTPIINSNQVVGSKAKRSIRSDSLVFENSICMVCRGDNVRITAKSEFFSINMDAVALEDASIGETALVRNTQSKRSFTAKVISADQLVVTL